MSSNAINLYIGNHNAASISDFVEFLSIEANDAGMRPVITHQLFPDTKNIVIECFNKDLNKQIKKLFSKNDPRLTLVATEIVKDGILNSTEPGEDEKQEGWYNTRSKYWIKRSKFFFDIVDYFGTIICVSEEIYSSIKALNLGAKLIYWPPRFYGSLECFHENWRSKNIETLKSHEFLYSGSLTSYRMSQLEALIGAGVTLMSIKQDTPDVVRHRVSMQTGLTIGPKHYKNTRQLSKMRVLWCLNNMYAFIMERCPARTDLDDFCLIYDDVEELIDIARDIGSIYPKSIENNHAFAVATKDLPSVLLPIL